MTITIDVPSDWEAELQTVAYRHGKEVSAFLRDSIGQQLRRDVLSEADTHLFAIINAPLDGQARKWRDTLLQAQRERFLTNAEQDAI